MVSEITGPYERTQHLRLVYTLSYSRTRASLWFETGSGTEFLFGETTFNTGNVEGIILRPLLVVN